MASLATSIKGKTIVADEPDPISPLSVYTPTALSKVTASNSFDFSSDATSLPQKIKIFIFDGSDPIGCIARAEKFFEVNQTKENQKVTLVMISMEGHTLH